MRHALPTVALVLLAACASTPEPAPPLDRLVVPPLDYVAELSDRGLLEGEETVSFELDPDGGELVGISCVLLSVDAADVRASTGRTGLRAFSAPLAQARELVRVWRERDPSCVVSSPSLVLHDAQRGTIAVVNQTAYVSGYRIVQQQATVVADPIIEVLSHGLVLEASATATGAREASATTAGKVAPAPRVALDVRLRLAGLHDPIAQHPLTLEGGLAEVTLQEPLVSRQRLETSIDLGADECLVLIAEDLKRPERALVSLVVARPLTPEETEAMRSPGSAKRLEDLFRLPE